MMIEEFPDADAFTVEVCWHYFVNQLTQAQIAKAMGVTRLRVNQAIQRARSLGIVKIEIDSPLLPRFDLQDRLQARFGLNRALVAPANPAAYDYHLPCGAALASYLSERLSKGDLRKIGVSWGLTLQCAINRMMRRNHPDLEVISMIGGTSRGDALNAFGIASGLADRLGASYSLLAAPIFLSPQIDRAAFLAQDIFAEHFQKFTQLDVAILTASDISDHSYLIRTGLPAHITIADLGAAGVVGDVVCRFLDGKGDLVPTRLDACTVGIELDMLRRVPERVLAAAGPHKVRIIRAALQTGLANVLITDDATARLVLAE